jgi:hypothetical protein
MRFSTVLATALTIGAAMTSGATAAQQVVDDSQGRPITFDVQAAGVDVRGYAAILDRALHGDEISDVVVRVIPESRIAQECGSGALACYRWSSRGGARITVPGLPPARVTSSLVHEYGHHVDATYAHLDGARGLDGTARWWRARGMAQLLSSGQVAFDYSLGWPRSVAEIFAEDYSTLNAPQTRHGISWLGSPAPPVLDAIRADVGGGAPAPNPGRSGSGETKPPGAPPSATSPAGGRPGKRAKSRFRERGRIPARRRRSIPFPVQSVRRVRAVVRVTKGKGRRPLKAVLRCNATTIAARQLRKRRPAVLVARRVTPGQCTVRLVAKRSPVKYRLAVRKIRTP